jgi:hypothetical protein
MSVRNLLRYYQTKYSIRASIEYFIWECNLNELDNGLWDFSIRNVEEPSKEVAGVARDVSNYLFNEITTEMNE